MVSPSVGVKSGHELSGGKLLACVPQDDGSARISVLTCLFMHTHRALVAKEWEREYSGPLCKQRGIPRGCQVVGRELKHSGNKPGIYRGLPGQKRVPINRRSQGLGNKGETGDVHVRTPLPATDPARAEVRVMEYYTELAQGLRASGQQGSLALITRGENHRTCRRSFLRPSAHCPLPANVKGNSRADSWADTSPSRELLVQFGFYGICSPQSSDGCPGESVSNKMCSQEKEPFWKIS